MRNSRQKGHGGPPVGGANGTCGVHNLDAEHDKSKNMMLDSCSRTGYKAVIDAAVEIRLSLNVSVSRRESQDSTCCCTLEFEKRAKGTEQRLAHDVLVVNIVDELDKVASIITCNRLSEVKGEDRAPATISCSGRSAPSDIAKFTFSHLTVQDSRYPTAAALLTNPHLLALDCFMPAMQQQQHFRSIIVSSQPPSA